MNVIVEYISPSSSSFGPMQGLQCLSRDGSTVRLPSNKVTTCKYTLLNFLPNNILKQFTRYPNVFLLTVLILQLIPQLEAPTPWFTTAILLAVILIANILTEGIAAHKAHNSTEKLNQRLVYALRQGVRDGSTRILGADLKTCLQSPHSLSMRKLTQFDVGFGFKPSASISCGLVCRVGHGLELGEGLVAQNLRSFQTPDRWTSQCAGKTFNWANSYVLQTARSVPLTWCFLLPPILTTPARWISATYTAVQTLR